MADLLTELKNDLQMDTMGFHYNILEYQLNTKEVDLLLSLTDFDNFTTDSLQKLLFPNYLKYDININTFTKISNLGIAQISENDSLSNQLFIYYTIFLNQFCNILDWEVSLSYQEGDYLFFTQNDLEINTVFPAFQDSITNRKALIKIITSPKVRNFLVIRSTRKKAVLSSYEAAKKYAEELISGIENELNKNHSKK